MANILPWAPLAGRILWDIGLVSLVRAGAGSFVVDGCDVHEATPNSKSVIVDSGHVYYEGTYLTNAGATLDLTPYIDATYPVMVIIYIDLDGVPRAHAGTPAAITPVTVVDWQLFKTPKPATSTLPVGVPLKLVYLAAGATSIANASISSVAIKRSDSGVPTTFVPLDIVTSKGDLLIGSAASAVDNLGIGTSGQVLTVDSVQPLGMKWQDAGGAGWTTETHFTATPLSTSTLTMTSDVTSTIKVGRGLRYTIGGVVYYGILTAITSNLLTLAGAPLGGNVTALSWCDSARVVQVDFFIPGTFADAANSGLLASDARTKFSWGLGKAYCVQIKHTVRVADTGVNQSRGTISIDGSVVGTDNSNTGLTYAATWTTTVVGINTSNYDINKAEAIEIVTDANGSNDDAQDLTMSAIFVLA